MRDKSQDIIVEGIENRNGRKVKVGKFFCVLNNKTYLTLGGLRNAIKPQMTIKEYYIKFYKKEDEGYCIECGNKTSFIGLVEGYKKYCCSKCHNTSEKHRKCVSNRFIGDDNKKTRAYEKRNDTLSKKSREDKSLISKKRADTIREKYGIIFAIKNTINDNDANDMKGFLDMIISSQAQDIEKVQRPSEASEYRPIVLGSGSARRPKC